MTPHRHTGVVIDYSDKCTCFLKIGESMPGKSHPDCYIYTLERYEICLRIPSVLYSAGFLLMGSPHTCSFFRLRKYIDRCHVGL